MSGEAEAALGLAVAALLERDVEKARRVIDGDRAIDTMEMELEEMCINLLVSRNLERVADLATNIGEDVGFLVEGKSIKHDAEEMTGT